MEQITTEGFAAALALIGAVIVVAALLSGLIERSNLPQVAIFLAMGAVIGAPGLGLLNVSLDSPMLRVVATLSLTLVLFTDALNLDIAEARKHWQLAFRVLVPGTLLSAALISLAGWWLVGLPLAAAVIVGASLASTDPVLLRGLLRRRDIPAASRQALRLESGLNDVVLLPVIIVAMAFLGHSTSTEQQDWAHLSLNLFLLGPAAGVGVGMLGVATLDLIRRRIGVRRDYESLYSLGVAFAAFAAAEALHGSGFLAAFAAGLTISALDVELCDCFLEYGETTAEMALLFTFVLFGSSLIWTGFDILSVATLLFAVLVLLIRPVAFAVALLGTRLSRRDRILISVFGPRGLSTLLLVLLPVFAGLPGGERMFAVCSLVVLLSVVVHGGSLTFWKPRAPRHAHPDAAHEGSKEDRKQKTESRGQDSSIAASMPLIQEPALEAQNAQDNPSQAQGQALQPSTVNLQPGSPNGQATDGQVEQVEDARERDPDRISVAKLRQLQDAGERVIVLDVRTDRTYDGSEWDAVGAIRMTPFDTARQVAALGIPKDAWLVAFCA